MPLPQDKTSNPAAPDAASVDGTFPRVGAAAAASGDIITSLGHMSGVLQTIQTGAGTPTVVLEGSNDRTNWTTIGSNAHTGSDAKETVFVDKGYRYFRARKSVSGATGTIDYYLRLTGMGGGA